MRRLRCRLARRHLHRAERAFFDAYGRGGALAHAHLVIPLGFFDRPEVHRELCRWRTGAGAPDLGALEGAWRAATPDPKDVAVFYRNLAHFLALA